MVQQGNLIGGRYEVIRALGRGSFGTTYEVLDRELRERVALKVTDRITNRRVEQRLRREVHALRRLSHPNMVRLFDVVPLDGRLGLVMELIPGGALSSFLSAPLSLRNVLETAIAIAKALKHVHGEGFIHRDVKPANILIPVDPAGAPNFREARLADFGLVQHGASGRAELIGTPAYMPIEQYTGRAVDARADIFSLGAVIYTMLFAKGPYEQTTVAASLGTILFAETHVPRTRSDLPRPLVALVERMLKREPASRPSSMVEVLATLERILSSGTRGALLSRARGPSWSSIRRVVLPLSVALAAVAITILVRRAPTLAHPALLLVLGVGAGLACAWIARVVIARRRTALNHEATLLLGRAGDRDLLSRSLALDIDELLDACRRMDQRFFAQSLALMMTEYQTAKASGDRQQALMNAVALLEKLFQRLSPWHVRNEKLIAVVISVVGAVAGAASAFAALIKK